MNVSPVTFDLLSLAKRFRGELRNEIDLQLWMHKRRKWSDAAFAPVAIPDLTDKAVQLLGPPSGGGDLQEKFASWLRDMGAAPTTIVSTEQIGNSGQHVDFLAISYEWFHQRNAYYRDLLRLRSRIQRSKLPVLCCAPDTVLNSFNLAYGMSVTQNGGLILLLQNTAREGHTCGLPFVTQPTFWTWPTSELEQWRAGTIEKKQREPYAFLAGTGGGSERRVYMRALEENFRRVGWKVFYSDGSLNKSAYISKVGNAECMATTSVVQDVFRRRRLSRWEPSTTVTGRVWEGFAAGTAVITNQATVLDELGFLPGVHYLDIDDVTADPHYFEGVSHLFLEEVGQQGQERFFHLIDLERGGPHNREPA